MTEVEFICEDCAVLVLALGYERPPIPPKCSVCQWIEGYVPASERPALRERLGVPLVGVRRRERGRHGADDTPGPAVALDRPDWQGDQE